MLTADAVPLATGCCRAVLSAPSFRSNLCLGDSDSWGEIFRSLALAPFEARRDGGKCVLLVVLDLRSDELAATAPGRLTIVLSLTFPLIDDLDVSGDVGGLAGTAPGRLTIELSLTFPLSDDLDVSGDVDGLAGTAPGRLTIELSLTFRLPLSNVLDVGGDVGGLTGTAPGRLAIEVSLTFRLPLSDDLEVGGEMDETLFVIAEEIDLVDMEGCDGSIDDTLSSSCSREEGPACRTTCIARRLISRSSCSVDEVAAADLSSSVDAIFDNESHGAGVASCISSMALSPVVVSYPRPVAMVCNTDLCRQMAQHPVRYCTNSKKKFRGADTYAGKSCVLAIRKPIVEK